MVQTPHSDCAPNASASRNSVPTTHGSSLGNFRSAIPGQSRPSILSASRAMRFASFLIVLLAVCFPAFSHATNVGIQFNGALSTFRGSLHQPYGVVTDSAGNIYIDNSLDGVLLKETPASDGTYTESVVATGLGYSFAVAVDGQGDLFTINNICGNANCNTIVEFKPQGNQYVQSTISTSPFNNPYGIAVDSSGTNVFVADTNNSRIVKITKSGGNWTETVLATDIVQPQAIAVDASGSVYVVPNNGYVILLTPSGGTYTESNLVQPAGISQMSGILLDAAGDMYIADTVGNKVLKLVPSGGGSYGQSTYIGNGLSGPKAMAFGPNGSLFVVDNGNNRVAQFSNPSVSFGSVPVGTTSNTILLNYTVSNSVFIGGISYLTQGAAGLDFADAGSDTCVLTTPAVGIQPQNNPGTYTCNLNVNFTPKAPGQRLGAVIFQDPLLRILNTTYLSGVGVGPQVAFPAASRIEIDNNFNAPYDTVVDASGNLYIANSHDDTIIKETLSGGTYTRSTIASLPGVGPTGVAVDGAGNVFIAGGGSSTIYKLPWVGTTYATLTTIATNGNTAGQVQSPYYITVDGMGNLFVTDSYYNYLYEFPWTGNGYNLTAVKIGNGLNVANALRTDSKGNLFIADRNNKRVLEIPWNGAAYALMPTELNVAGLVDPEGIALDHNDNLYIADNTGEQLLRLQNLGGGNFGPATKITVPGGNLARPTGLGFDGAGNLFVLQNLGNDIFELPATTPPSLTFGLTATGSQSSDSPQKVTISNNGNAPLVFPSPSTGLNPSPSLDFSFDNISTCSVASSGGSSVNLAAGSACTLAIDYIPTSAGTNNGSIVLTDNNLKVAGSTQTIPVTGSAFVPVTAFTITGYPTTTPAGPGITYTVTAYNNTNIATAYTGTVTFTTSDHNGGFLTTSYTFTGADAGVHTFTTNAYFHTVGNQTITVTDGSVHVAQTSNNILVTAGTPARITATGGTPQSVVIGGAFTNPLGVLIADSFGNPVSGITVNFAAPSSGASATLSPGVSAVTANDGTASVTATANGTAGSYYVVASSPSLRNTVGGGIVPQGSASTSVNFALTNLSATPTVTITSPVAGFIAYGQSSTAVRATVSYTTGTPTGTVTFSNSGNSLGAAATLSGGVATFPTAYYTPGTYTFGAAYSGDSNYNTASASTVTFNVNKASSTLTGPASSPYLVVYQTTGAVLVSIAGQYSGAGISAPTGQVTCGIYSGGNQVASSSLTISSGAVSAPVANTLAPGLYSVVCNYGGDSNYNAASQLTASLQVGQIQPTISWTQPSNIVYGTTLSNILNAVALDGQNAVTGGGTYAYTATVSGGSPVAVTSSIVLPAGSYTLGVTFTPTNTQTYKSATGTVTLVVTQATSSVALVSSSNPSLTTTSVTFTATVSSSSTTPTGTVTFFNGSTALGSAVALVNGVATLPISTLPIGTDSISASYNGDNNFTGSNSNKVSQVVEDFSLTLSTIGGSVTAVSVLPGGTATYTLVVSPVAPATIFPSVVNLAVTGLPTGATYTLSQTSIPAGSGPVTLTLTVTTSTVPPVSSMNGGAPQIMNLGRGLAPLSLALLLLPFASRMRRVSKRMARIVSVLVLLAAGIAATAGLSGCGATTGFFGQASKTYTISITGTSGTLVHSTTVTLTVE